MPTPLLTLSTKKIKREMNISLMRTVIGEAKITKTVDTLMKVIQSKTKESIPEPKKE